MVFRSVDAWVMITIFPVIVVMSGVTRGDQYPTLISLPARWVTNCSPQAWSIRLLSQSLIQRSNFPELLQNSWNDCVAYAWVTCAACQIKLTSPIFTTILFYFTTSFDTIVRLCTVACCVAQPAVTGLLVLLCCWCEVAVVKCCDGSECGIRPRLGLATIKTREFRI